MQIKRPDPHFPEGHDNQENPEANPEAAEMLISEPACCPYCQQPEFGVTYDAPPFRRGLTYHMSSFAFDSLGPAMSSNSSLGSTSPTPFTSPPPSGAGGRRRTQSLSANDPGVITTDRVRQDWAVKLAAQRNHLARRAAAATALHTAAFLMNDQGSRPFSRMSRFGRRNNGGRDSVAAGTTTTITAGADAAAGPEPGARSSSSRGLLQGPQADRRQTHMENLENMMLAEAIRLSLAAEEERKRKADKEERKEAKKKEKEERKAAKAAAKGQPYSSHSSASGSTMSLPGLSSINGRRRGNSGASNLRVEATTARAMASAANLSPPRAGIAATSNDKGKGVDRGLPQTPPEAEIGKSNVDAISPAVVSSSTPAPAPTASPRPVPSPLHSAGPSHLRQMSSASSVSSSGPDSRSESYQDTSYLQANDPHGSGLSLGVNDESGDEGGRTGDENDAEPRFNFTSLAEMVGVELEGANAGRRLSQIGESHAEDGTATTVPTFRHNDSDDKRSSTDEATAHHVEDSASSNRGEDALTKSIATITQGSHIAKAHSDDDEEGASGSFDTPQLTITPETPTVDDHGDSDSKQLGFQGTRTVELQFGDGVTD